MEEMKDFPIKVYIKVNKNNEIIDIGSSVFISDTTGWIEIDSGFGDKYAHSQNLYLSKPLRDADGNLNYKYVNNKITEIKE